MKVKQKSKNYVLYLLSRRSQRVTHVVYKFVSYHFVTQLQTEKLRIQEKLHILLPILLEISTKNTTRKSDNMAQTREI